MRHEEFVDHVDTTVESDGDSMVVTYRFTYEKTYKHGAEQREEAGDAELMRSDKVLMHSHLCSEFAHHPTSVDQYGVAAVIESGYGDHLNALIEYLDDPANLVGGSVLCPSGREWIGPTGWMVEPLVMRCLWAAISLEYGQYGVGESMVDDVDGCVDYLRSMRSRAYEIMGTEYVPSDSDLLSSVVNRMRA